MSIHQILPQGANLTTNYLPAILKENKSGWIIEYYAEHPATHVLTRKQIRLTRLVSRYRSTKDARVHCLKMVQTINNKLSGGWNPFFEDEDARLYEKLTSVSDKFLKEKKKELRENSLRSYSSFINLLTEWVNKNNPDLFASMFNQILAVRYMDYIYNQRNVGVTTYNNQIKMGRAFFNWMLEKCYTKQNPFSLIKSKPKPTKTRIIIPADIRNKIIEDLQINNPEFLLMCKLMFASLIRPNELRQLTINEINLSGRYLYIPANVAKNHKERYCTITEDIISAFRTFNIDKYPKSFFIFGSSLKPAKTKAGNGRYGEEWDKLRKRIKLPPEMQMYSLRDSGINAMLKSGIDDLSVMQHADHSSLEMTTLYGNHYDPKLNELMYNNLPKF
jgi:integrase